MKNMSLWCVFSAFLLNVIALELAESDRQLAKNQVNATAVRTNAANSFLVLQDIKRELNEVMSGQKRKQHRLVKNFSKAFGKDEVKKTVVPLRFLGAAREKRSLIQDENGFSEEIQRLIEDNFPCRDPKTLALIRSGTTYFNEAECSQCTCYMAKLTCEKNLRKCYPNACHLQDGEFIRNFAIHNDGCNNCLCYFGELICTHLRCPEAGHRYTNYKSMGLENIEPESNLNQPAGFESSTRKPDSCLECDHLTGSSVCGLKQWKTFPTFCHAMFCGKNSDKQIDDSGGCESLNPCVPSPCTVEQQCVPFYQSSCLAGQNTSLCEQFICIPTDRNCPKEDTTGVVCGEDGQSYESECEMVRSGAKFAYTGNCKKNCQSEVCGIESRTYSSRCHANDINAHVDYKGRCEYYLKSALMKDDERGSSFEDKRCEMVYENGRCSSVRCEATVLPPGACCPICGSALVISVNYKTGIKHPYRLQELHAFLTKSQKQAHLCKMSVDITYAIDILIVIEPYKDYHLETCKDLAVEISDRMNFERNQDETGIFAMLGAATVVKEKARDICDVRSSYRGKGESNRKDREFWN